MIDLNEIYTIFDEAITMHRYNGNVVVYLGSITEEIMKKLNNSGFSIVSVMSTPTIGKFAVELGAK